MACKDIKIVVTDHSAYARVPGFCVVMGIDDPFNDNLPAYYVVG